MKALDRARACARPRAASCHPRRILAARTSRSTAGTNRARKPRAMKSSAPAFIAAAAIDSPNREETMITGRSGQAPLISRRAAGPSRESRPSWQMATSQASGFKTRSSASRESTRSAINSSNPPARRASASGSESSAGARSNARRGPKDSAVSTAAFRGSPCGGASSLIVGFPGCQPRPGGRPREEGLSPSRILRSQESLRIRLAVSADRGEQVGELERLSKELSDPPQLLIAGSREGGEDNDRDVRQLRILALLRPEFPAVHDRHHQIQQHQARPGPAAQVVEGLLPVGHRLDDITFPLQRSAE